MIASLLIKSRVATHLRHEHSGHTTIVKEYSTKVQKRATVTAIPDLKEQGKILAEPFRLAKFRKPKLLENPVVETKDGEKTAHILQTKHLVKKTKPKELKPGAAVVYKREGQDQRTRYGILVKETAKAFFVQPKRTMFGQENVVKVNKTGDTFMTVQAFKRARVKKKDKDSIYTPEGDRTMARLNLTTDELLRRKKVIEDRLGFEESRIVSHPSFIGPAIKISAGLALDNNVSTAMLNKPTASLWHQAADPNYQEILFHYAQGAIKGWRRVLAHPLTDEKGKRREDADQTENNIKEFKEVLANQKHSSYAHYVMEKEGKSNALRWIQEWRRNRDLMQDQDIHDMIEDPEARRLLSDKSSQPLQLKYTLMVNKEGLNDDIQKVLLKLNPTEKEVMRMDYGFPPYKEPMKNNTLIADKLNKMGSRDPDGNKWTRNSVGVLKGDALAKLASEATKEELSYHYDDALGRPVWKSLLGAIVNTWQKSIIAVDFDGVIADYSQGYQGQDVFGEPLPGAAEGIRDLQTKGHRIIIFTTRPDTPTLREYLQHYKIPYDAINENLADVDNDTSGKVMAEVYLDDRAVRFQGWDQARASLAALEQPGIEKSIYLEAPLTRIHKDLHPAGLFKAGEIEYEIAHEGDEAVLVKGGSFEDIFEEGRKVLLKKAFIAEIEEAITKVWG